MGILAFFIGIAVLCTILKIIALPFKIIFKFIVNSIVGGIVLWLLAFFGIGIAINNTIILLTGLFGLPGLVFALLITVIL